ncbi:hypothetical protein [Yoonia sp.]|uniref:hypothetical protein n=1 Tax=Yoonia sp. TaxID=2212373 RepID=UPI003F6D7C43
MLGLAPAIPPRNDLDWCWFLRRQGREGEALERLLHDIGVMTPTGWADWAPGTLTATGAPVELIFSPENPGLCLRTEVADPASDPANRVEQVCRLMASLGGTAPGAALRDVVSAAQGAGDLRFGAWLGLHQRRHSVHSQLFAELPAAATDLADLIYPPGIRNAIEDCGASIEATLLEQNGTNGVQTIHFTACGQIPLILRHLAAIADVSEAILAMALARLTGHHDTNALYDGRLAFSLTQTIQDRPPVLRLHIAAADLSGTDRQIAAKVLEFCPKPMLPYTSLIDMLPASQTCQSHHGSVTLTARPGAAPAVAVGVAALSSCPYGKH